MSRTGALLLPSLFGLMSCQPQVVISEAHAPLGEGVFKMLLSLVSHIITTMGLDFWCCKSFPQHTLLTPEILRSIKQVALRTEIYLWLKSPCGQPCDFLMWRAEGRLREKFPARSWWFIMHQECYFQGGDGMKKSYANFWSAFWYRISLAYIHCFYGLIGNKTEGALPP